MLWEVTAQLRTWTFLEMCLCTCTCSHVLERVYVRWYALIYILIWVNQKWIWGVFLYHSLFSSVRQHLSLKLELTKLARLACQWTLTSSCLTYPTLIAGVVGICLSGFDVGSGYWDQVPLFAKQALCLCFLLTTHTKPVWIVSQLCSGAQSQIAARPPGHPHCSLLYLLEGHLYCPIVCHAIVFPVSSPERAVSGLQAFCSAHCLCG